MTAKKKSSVSVKKKSKPTAAASARKTAYQSLTAAQKAKLAELKRLKKAGDRTIKASIAAVKAETKARALEAKAAELRRKAAHKKLDAEHKNLLAELDAQRKALDAQIAANRKAVKKEAARKSMITRRRQKEIEKQNSEMGDAIAAHTWKKNEKSRYLEIVHQQREFYYAGKIGKRWGKGSPNIRGMLDAAGIDTTNMLPEMFYYH